MYQMSRHIVAACSKVIPEDVYVDSRLFAMRSANHVSFVHF